MRVNHREPDLENHDRGLDYDLPRVLHRRGMLKLVVGAGLAGAGLVTLGACATSTTTTEATPGSDGSPERSAEQWTGRRSARRRAAGER